MTSLQSSARTRLLRSSRLELRFETFFSDVFIAWIDLTGLTAVDTSKDDRNIKATIFIFKFGGVRCEV